MQQPEEKSRINVVRIFIYLIPIFAIIAGYGAIIVVTQESYPFTIVTGTSMQPTIMPGTIAVIDRTPFNQLKVGDIIVFTPQIALENSCNDLSERFSYSHRRGRSHVISFIGLFQLRRTARVKL